MKLATSQELHAYWSLLRGARSAPERAEIDPGAIRAVLADTFILEVDPSARYTIRVSGARTNSLFARELKGASFLELWRTPDRGEVASMLASVAREAAAIVAGASSDPTGARAVDLELLLLPLRHHGKTDARILGSLTPASLPSWLGLFPAGALSLLSLRVLRCADSAPREVASAADEDAPARAFGRPPALTRHGHLFVHQGEARSR